MSSRDSEPVGKVFVVVRRMRRCLICNSRLTPECAAEHAGTACLPETLPKSEKRKNND